MPDTKKEVLSRRTFLKAASTSATGLVIALHMPSPGARLLAQEHHSAAFQPNAFLTISEDNSIKVLLSHSEMGQGQWTTLPILIAEELDVAVTQIQVEHAPAADAYKIPGGWQMTVGSGSTKAEFDRYRSAGADDAGSGSFAAHGYRPGTSENG